MVGHVEAAIESMPAALQAFAEVNPFTIVVRAVVR
jgi:hypothetical protein